MKKTLSFVLALCMLVSIMPTFAQDPGITIKYDLSAAMKLEGMTTLSTAKAPSEIDYEDTNGLLDVVVYGAGNGVPDNNFRYYQKSTSADSDYNMVLRQNQILAMEIYVPVSGTYKMIAHRGIAKPDLAGDVEVYIYKGEFSDTYKWNVGTKFGRYNCVGSDYGFARLGDTTVNEISAADATVTTDTPATIELQAGKYVVAFERVGMTGYYGSVGGFSLVSGDGSGSVPVNLSSVSIKNSKASIEAVMSDGSIKGTSEIDVTYTSSNTEIAAIDAKSGKITDVASGETTITATATLLGREVSVSTTYTAEKEAGPVNNLTIKYDLSAAMKLEGMKTLSKDKALSVIDYEDTNGLLDVVSYGIGSEIPDNNWFYYNKSTTADSDYNVVMRANKVLAMEIYVPEDGTYQMVAHRGYNNSDNGVVEVYIAEGSFSDTYKWNVGTKFGQYECYGSNHGFAKLADVTVHGIGSEEPATIELKTGKYVVAFERVGMEGYYGSVGGFSLVSGDGSGSVPINLASLAINDKTASVQAVMSDGSTKTVSDVDVTYTSSNTAAATVDSKTGKITDVASGETTITATATLLGREVSVSATYNSEAEQAPTNNLTIKYDLSAAMKLEGMTTLSTAKAPSEIDYEDTNGLLDVVVYGAGNGVPDNNFRYYQKSTSADSDYNMVLRQNQILAMEIYVPVSGTYKMIAHRGIAKPDLAGDVEVYIYKGEFSDAYKWNVGTKFGRYNCAGSDYGFARLGDTTVNEISAADATVTTDTPATIELQAGKYVVAFERVGMTGYYGSVGGFSLVSGDGSEIIPVCLGGFAIENDKASVQNIVMSDGSVSELGDTKVTYTSLNPDIATVDAVTGVITKVTTGEATITATATVLGREVVASRVYNSVVESVPNLTLKYDLSAAMKLEGMKTLTKVKAPSVIDYEDTNNTFDVLSYGIGAEIPDNNWFYYNKSTSADSDYNIVMRVNKVFAMEIYVPVSGKYQMVAHRGYDDADNGVVEVYVANGAFSDAYKWNVGTQLGRYECKGSDRGYSTLSDATVHKISSDEPATIELEAGYHVVAFHRVGMEGYYGSIGGFSLVSGNGNGTVPVSVGNLSIKNRKASAQLILSDGTATELGDVEVTYKSSDETIATIDAKSGAITNVGAGEVTITATAEVNGRNTTTSVVYTSMPPDPNGITIKYDLNADIQKVADAKGWGVPAIVPYFTPDLLTSEITNGFYEYFNFTYKSFISNSFYFRPGAKGFVTRDDSIASFKINVPKAGIYDLNVKHSANSTGLDVRVYISKDNYSTADADYVGTYSSKDPSFTGTSDFSSVNGAVEKTSTITNVEISEPGEYIITFQPQDATVGNAASWTYGAVGSFELVAGNKSVLMYAKTDYDLIPLGVGAKYTLGATGILSDRTEVKMNLSGFTGYDETVISVSENGIVRGLKNGKTTVTYNAEYNGMVKQLSTVIEVGGKGISIKYNFGADIVKLYGMEYATLLKLEDFTYESSGGFFRYFKGSRPVPVGGRFNAYKNFIGLSDGEYVTYEIFVPQAGTYDMTIEHGMYDQALEVDVFVSRVGTSFAAEDKVGYFDCNRDGETNVYNATTTTIKGAMFPKAGTYYITFQPTNRQDGNTSWYWGFIGDMTLKSGEEAVLAGIIQAEKPEDNELIILGIEESSIEWTDVNVPATTNAYVQIKKVNGGTPVNVAENIRFKSSANKIADVDTDGLVTGHSDGTCQITVSAKVAGTQYSAPLNLSVEDNTGVRAARFGIPSALYLRQKAKAPVVITMNSGNEVTVPAELVSYTYSPEGIVTIDNHGVAECIAVGETTVTATADFRGSHIEVSGAVTTEEHKGKSEPTYFTYEKRENAMNNIKKYSWARATRDSAVAAADKALNIYEVLYNQLPEAGIPTAGHITKTQDPNWNICHYCNINLSENYGNYSNVQWKISPATNPWKIQCPACKRMFPSNDFALLYERGRDERGHYDIDRALAANAEAVANGEKDALVNELYTEIANVDTINCGQGLRPGETVETWGVDAGLGYFPKDENGNNYTVQVGNSKVTEMHIYVPYYHLLLWSEVENAITNFADAYVYTGDLRYGRAGAILLDRVADVWPEYDMRRYNSISDHTYFLADASTGYGKVRGKISDSTAAEGFARATDALYPAIYDSAVINFLSDKANDFGLENDKSSSEKIWENWADRILMETFESVQGYMIHGNFGWHQSAVAMAAVSLAQEPESTEMVEWLYRSGDERIGAVEGGNILSRLVDVVDRDGLGNEVADNYNSTWVTSISTIADYLTAYKGDKNYNLYSHPKYVQMFMPYLAKTIVGKQSTNLGDSGATGSTGIYGFAAGTSPKAFMDIYNANNEGDEALLAEFAQQIYLGNGYSTKGLATGIFDKDPEEIQDILNRYELSDSPLTRSDMLTGYGLAVLRAGNDYKSASMQTAIDNQRDFWLYFGRRLGHGHSDVLGLGIDAFGFSLSPDLGYPAVSGKDPETLQWATATISHNTVVVDGKDQPEYFYSATPLHFDDSGFVKVTDADASDVYKATEQYRRTVVMIEVDDDISYGVDFFRVRGGDKHTFSFHGAAETVNAVSGLGEVTKQVDADGNYVGSYVGPDVPVGPDPNSPDVWYYDTVYPRGYTWLSKVRRYNEPEADFSVEFDIQDYRKVVKNNKGIKLRMTQMNNFTPDEVAFVGGRVPVRSDNNMFPKTLDYVLVQREGTNLDSLFTTVYEPYQNTRYVESITSLDDVTIVSGSEEAGDTHNVVKVTHTSGRVDYIFYASNNTVKYKLTDGEREIFFRGFVGVYTVNSEGKLLSRYVNDGTVIGNDEAIAEIGAYNGTIKAFDEEFGFGDFENWIDVNIECEDMDTLAGKYIYIENDGAQNGGYKIVGASKNDDGSVRLDLGAVSVVRSFADAKDIDGGYIYNIDVGQNISIPLVNVENNRPVFAELNDASTSAGSSVKINVHAESPLEDGVIQYVATALPRGAILNTVTGEISWTPDSSQVGENHFAVKAVDSDGRESTLHFTVEVYGSTTGGTTKPTTPSEPTTPSTPSTPSGSGSGSSGGGGGGGGGATPAPSTPTVPTIPTTPTTPDVDANVRFIDLGNHAWAADAINSLADEGIIKGTSANTFSPAANITRADFAILLVRAFELASENEENFADVNASDYFAKELAVARNTGLVNGIGENKFAPRNNITRQDMMVIVYRALTGMNKLNVGDGVLDVPQASDFDQVAEYAKEAVSVLVNAGLVNGKNGLIDPTAYTTRAEVAVLIKRILDYTKA